MAFVYRYPSGIQSGKLWLELEKAWTLPNDNFMAHSHEYMEMTLITHGNGWHRVAGQEHLTTPGDVIIVPPGVVHSYFRSRNQTHRKLSFRPGHFAGTPARSARHVRGHSPRSFLYWTKPPVKSRSSTTWPVCA